MAPGSKYHKAMQINDVISFTGRQDSDTTPRFLKPGDYLRVVNGHAGLSSSGQQFVVEAVNGTTPVAITYGSLASGTNKVIGRLEHRESQRIFFAVWNSNSNHKIFEYNAKTAVLQQVAEGQALGFEENAYLNNPSLIGDMLYWVDGGAPKKINVERAKLLGKKEVLRLCFGGVLQGFQGSLTITFSNAFTLPPPFSFPYSRVIKTSAWTPSTYTEFLDLITQNLNSDLFLTDICELSFLRKQGYVEMTSNVPMSTAGRGQWQLSFAFTPSTPQEVVIRPYFFYENSYRLPLTAASLSRAKQPPLESPAARYVVEAGKTGLNRIYGQSFQFACRYIYDDDEITTVGPISSVSIDQEYTGRETLAQQSNAIYLDIQEEYLTSDHRHDIRAVDLVFRKPSESTWLIFRRLNSGDLGFTQIFYNDGYYQGIDVNDVLRPFYAVPLKSKAQEFAQNRGFLTADEEGYDPIDVNMTATAVRVAPGAVTSKQLYNIKGNIVVRNLNGGAVQKRPLSDRNRMGRMEVPLGGLVVYLAGTNYSVISTERNSGSALVYEFEIKDVPVGRYILRVASHLLRSDDLYGPVYFYSKENTLYQQTSTNVIATNGGTSFGHEVLVEISNSDVDLSVSGGTFLVVVPENPEACYYVHGYLKDTFTATPSIGNVKSGQQVERVFIDFKQNGVAYVQGFRGSDLQVAQADHNGYFFFFATAAPIAMSASEVRLGSKTGLLVASFAAEGFFWNGSPFPTIRTQFGVTGEISAVDVPASTTYDLDSDGFGELQNNQRTMIVARSIDSRTTFATRIVGTALSTTSQPVRNYCVAIANTGRTALTGIDGTYSILVYATDTTGNQRPISVNASYQGNREIVNPGRQTVATLLAIGTTWTFNTPFTTNLTAIQVLNDFEVGVNMLKSGGRYRWACLYLDAEGRNGGAFGNREVEIRVPDVPSPTKFSDFYLAEIRIRHRAPSWAKKMLLVRTRDLVYQRYVQLPVLTGDVKFAKRNANGAFDVQTVADADTVAFAIELTAVKQANASGQQAAISYQRSPGDRVRYANETGAVLDREIVGQDAFAVFVDRQAGDVLGENIVLEFYQPRAITEEDLYFTIGLEFDILANGFHAGNIQNQTGAQDCIIRTNIGDAFCRFRSLSGFGYYCQDPNVYDDSVSAFQSTGRPTVLSSTDDISNPGLRKLNRGYVIRASNAFVQDTKINGLSEFIAENQESLPINEGQINTLYWDGRSIISLTETMSRRILVAEAFVKNIDGTDDTIRARQELFGGNRPVGQFGTLHPEGVCRYRGTMMYWDQNQGCLVFYDGQQSQDFSATNAMLTISQQLKTLLGQSVWTRISSCYDFSRKEFVVSFLGRNNVGATVVARVLKLLPGRGCIGEYDFVPEELAGLESNLYSFVAGAMHIHNDTVNRMRFYGVQRKMTLQNVINEAPDQRKVLDAIKVMCNQAPAIPEITTDEGQNSELAATDFQQIEGNNFYAGFLYDKNTPLAANPQIALVDGDEMRSTHFAVTMEFNGPQAVIFTAAEVSMTLSR